MATYTTSLTPGSSTGAPPVFTVSPSATQAPRRTLAAQTARMMGTTVSAQIAAPPAQATQAQAAVAQCMAWFAEVNARLSRFDAESEISHLNRASGRWFAASPTLFAAVAIAVAAAQGSGGLFDPTLLPQIEALGYDRDFAQIARREIVLAGDVGGLAPTHPSASGWRAIALDATQRRIYLPEGVRLDLGGIAKGWAADVALERYCAGFPGALLNVGGDLRVHGGPQPGQAWAVGLRDPRAEAAADGGGEADAGETAETAETPTPDATPTLATVTLSAGGLATSGAAKRWWLRNGAPQHHLLDPRTGRPARLWISDAETARGAQAVLLAAATALAPTATQAEVVAKLALLRGRSSALHAVDAAWETATRQPADTNAALLLTLGTGDVLCSTHLNDYLNVWATERTPNAQATPAPTPWLADLITDFATMGG